MSLAAKRRRYGIPTGSYSEGMETVRSTQAAEREDPDLLLPMYGARMKAWKGQWLFFQDPSGTVRATEIGDPNGGLRDIVGGEIRAVQEVDAERPLLGVEELDFMDAYLTVPGVKFTRDDNFSAYIDATIRSAGDNTLIGQSDSGSSSVDDQDWRIRHLEPDDRMEITVGGERSFGTEAGALPVDLDLVASLVNISDSEIARGYVDGEEVEVIDQTGSFISETPVLAIGASGNGDANSDSHIRSVAIFPDSHDVQRVGRISEVLP